MQHTRALAIRRAIDSYLQDTSLPLVAYMRRNPQLAPTVAWPGG